MSTWTKDNAFPLSIDGDTQIATGLTKRELFAAMAMQGLLVHAMHPERHFITAEEAVAQADALLAELDKPTK